MYFLVFICVLALTNPPRRSKLLTVGFLCLLVNVSY